MRYKLAPGVHYCVVARKRVFLDLARDRYVLLNPQQQSDFEVLEATSGLAPDAGRGVVSLVDQGILELIDDENESSSLISPSATATTTATKSTARSNVSWTSSVIATGYLLAARASLRHLGLQRTICRLEATKEKSNANVANKASMSLICSSFDRAQTLINSHDTCLLRSIALMLRLSRNRIPAELVIGVALMPFVAHAWVQQGEYVLNDDPDFTRTFAPILRI